MKYKYINRSTLIVAATVVLVYFAAAFAFRMHRMDPASQYRGYHLPGYNPGVFTSEEETKEFIDALTREPTFFERFFTPAEFVFYRIGI